MRREEILEMQAMTEGEELAALQQAMEDEEEQETLRVQVPSNLVLGFWVVVIIVQVLGK